MKNVFVKEDACMGCGLCRVYCQTEHSRSRDTVRAWKKETFRPMPRIRVERKDDLFFSLQCRNCEQPWCLYSCLTGAMHRDPVTGVITVDEEKCVGCWTCLVACPNGAITRDSGRHIAAKCDLCPDRDVPACVANCPNEALTCVENGKAVEPALK